ncbi:MAG TPA: hypothetical protein VMI56_06550, partial [Reyranella sp.]|nr:hypothetical protein [Reyranella sp.]
AHYCALPVALAAGAAVLSIAILSVAVIVLFMSPIAFSSAGTSMLSSAETFDALVSADLWQAAAPSARAATAAIVKAFFIIYSYSFTSGRSATQHARSRSEKGDKGRPRQAPAAIRRPQKSREKAFSRLFWLDFHPARPNPPGDRD